MNPMASGRFTIAQKAAFRAGFADMLGPVPGVIAWGLVTGIAMVKMGLGVTASVAISLAAYAGSAQLATLPLVLGGAAWWVVFLTALVVNLRFLVYAATLGQMFGREPAGQRVLLGYFNGDVTFVRLLARIERRPDDPHVKEFYVGGFCGNWLGWQVGSLLGIFAASVIPTAWALEIAGILALVAVLAPALHSRPAVLGAAVAGLVSLLTRGLPLSLGVMAGLIAGLIAALIATPDGRTAPP